MIRRATLFASPLSCCVGERWDNKIELVIDVVILGGGLARSIEVSGKGPNDDDAS